MSGTTATRKRPGRGQSRARSPAREQTVVRSKSRFALRDDGLSYGDCVEQLTFVLFLKMAGRAEPATVLAQLSRLIVVLK